MSLNTSGKVIKTRTDFQRDDFHKDNVKMILYCQVLKDKIFYQNNVFHYHPPSKNASHVLNV